MNENTLSCAAYVAVAALLSDSRVAFPILWDPVSARELFAAGWRTPEAMLNSAWQQRVDALGRARYRRYDDRTATMLGHGAQLLQERWRGDLPQLRTAADGDLGQLRDLLIEFPGIGPAGADIFIREVQGVWTGFQPFVDGKMATGAVSTSGELALAADLAQYAERSGPCLEAFETGTGNRASARPRSASRLPKPRWPS